MRVELERKDIENLIKGTDVPYALMEDPIISKLGYYTGGFYDRWDWFSPMDKSITDEQLWETYQKLRE